MTKTRFLALWSLAVLLACSSNAAVTRVAIFREPGFPFFISNPEMGPEFAHYCLQEAGIEADMLSADELADPAVFNAQRYRVLVHVYGNTFPLPAYDNLRAFRQAGGSVLALGGVPFCHPCVREDGAWKDRMGQYGWEFVSHEKLGTGLWGDAPDVDELAHAPDDPLGLRWLPVAFAPPGSTQFLRSRVGMEASRAIGYEYDLGLPAEDEVIPVVLAIKDGHAVGAPICIIHHNCQQFKGAVDIWAGTTLGFVLTRQQQEQILVASCAYLLQEVGAMTAERRAEVLAAARKRFVSPAVPTGPPRGSFVFRASRPAKRLQVLDIIGLEPAEQFLALSLQGLVNRQQPRLYVVGDFKDAKWLNLLAQAGHEAAELKSLTAAINAYRGEIAGAIVTDPANPHTVNIATMLAGVERAVIATPELARRHGLRIVADLRGRWRNGLEAYEWALEELWPRLRPQALACMEPTWVAPRDYLIQFPTFVFWLDCAVSQPLSAHQGLFFERLLARFPPHTPIYGWWQHGDDGGIGEYRGVYVSSQYGQVTVCTVGAYNLSVHCGMPVPKALSQRRPAPGSLEAKVYLTFLISDGDNFGANMYSVVAGRWEQKMRGRVPVGWPFCPTQLELTPVIVEHWYRTATEMDEFLCMDGLGYVYPDVYGAALPVPQALDEFFRESGEYMRRLDHRSLWYLAGSFRAARMAHLLDLDGLFGEYGAPPSQRQELIGNTAAFWADVNPWEKPYDEVGDYIRRIKARAPRERPAFMMVGVNGFHIGPDEIAAILRELGPEYVAVRPDEFCELFRRWKTTGLDAQPEPRPLLDLMPPAAGATMENGRLVIREHDDEPDIAGWYTDPQGTPWVRKRLQVQLPAGVTQALVKALVRGQKGQRVIFVINGHQHEARLQSSSWTWAEVAFPANELRDGENEIRYTGNPDGRLFTAGDASTRLGHSEYGGPEVWTPLAGELMLTLIVW
ncbi:MAG: GxGYxYP family putative glycoside hydrolase [Armatimonadetes bacterium]|nr:GxGYxYP family putative glycoside hydrolase [Armatimonadota bacterium]